MSHFHMQIELEVDSVEALRMVGHCGISVQSTLRCGVKYSEQFLMNESHSKKL